jgi:hypothetical protein
MENLDIIILTTVVSTLFVVFGVLMYQELSSVDENTYKTSKDGGPRVYLMKMMGRLFDDEIPTKERKIIYKAVKRTMADMESDGIYFPEDVKERLRQYREEMNCEYSGLPSVKSYENE